MFLLFTLRIFPSACVWFLCPVRSLSSPVWDFFSQSISKMLPVRGNSQVVRRALFFWCLLNEVSLQGQTELWQNVQILPFESVRCVFWGLFQILIQKQKAKACRSLHYRDIQIWLKGFTVMWCFTTKPMGKNGKNKEISSIYDASECFKSSSNNGHYSVDR